MPGLTGAYLLYFQVLFDLLTYLV